MVTAQDIIELRNKLGMSREQFACKIGVTSSAVYKWERGTSVPHQLAQKAMIELRSQIGTVEN